MKLQGKVALVTGGSRGIGYAIAERFGREGAKLTIMARGQRRLEAAQERLKKEGIEVLALSGDVSQAGDVERVVKATLEEFGLIDILINNAGIGRMGELERYTEKDWDETLAINLKGVFLFTKAVFPIMKRQGSGTIINISSLAGKRAFAGTGAYSASKFGVLALTETTIQEGKPYGIRASAICPGYVATEMARSAGVPFEEMIQPEDVAETALLLVTLNPQVIVREVVLERRGA